MKRIFFGILLGCIALSANAQTMKELFVSQPETFSFDASNRLDLIDLYTAGEKAVISNAFNDSVFLVCLNEDYLKVQSGNLILEMFLLPLVNDSKLIGLIQTVCAPICDSRVDFFTVNWKKLSAETFLTIVDKSWFVEENSDFPLLDFSMMELHYTAENKLLTQTCNALALLSVEDKKTAEKYIRKNTKEYKWNGIRFE